jgi:hypothetical protein
MRHAITLALVLGLSPACKREPQAPPSFSCYRERLEAVRYCVPTSRDDLKRCADWGGCIEHPTAFCLLAAGQSVCAVTLEECERAAKGVLACGETRPEHFQSPE